MRRWCARPGPPTPRASGPGDLYADRRPNHWLGAVSLNKTPSASPLARLSPSHGASRIRKRAGSPSHQELLFPPPPTDLGCQRDRAGASIGSDPTLPSRTARKLILLRAYSASGGLIPRSPAHQNRSRAVSGRSEPWRRTPQPPRAQRESSSFPEPTQRPEARCRGAQPLDLLS